MPRRKISAAPARLTDAYLKKIKPPPGKRDLVIFEDRTGLGVRVHESGVVSFVVQFRMPDGRRFRETLRPSYPGLSVAKARAKLLKGHRVILDRLMATLPDLREE